MKVTVFKRKGTKETVVREDMNTIVDASRCNIGRKVRQ